MDLIASDNSKSRSQSQWTDIDSTHFDPPFGNNNRGTCNCVVRKRNICIDTTSYRGKGSLLMQTLYLEDRDRGRGKIERGIDQLIDSYRN